MLIFMPLVAIAPPKPELLSQKCKLVLPLIVRPSTKIAPPSVVA